jgi:hypothetical protein
MRTVTKIAAFGADRASIKSYACTPPLPAGSSSSIQALATISGSLPIVGGLPKLNFR